MSPGAHRQSHTGFKVVLVRSSEPMGAPTHPATSAAVNQRKRIIGKISERSESKSINECKSGKRKKKRVGSEKEMAKREKLEESERSKEHGKWERREVRDFQFALTPSCISSRDDLDPDGRSGPVRWSDHLEVDRGLRWIKIAGPVPGFPRDDFTTPQ